LRAPKSPEDAGDEVEMAQAVIATAKKALITQVVKRNVMENVVPLVLSLKHMVGSCFFVFYNISIAGLPMKYGLLCQGREHSNDRIRSNPGKG
jgi:hypothetical protein